MCSRSSNASASEARQRVMMKLVPPRRRLPWSFVMKPRCANDVPVKERPPPSHVSPMSVCVMKASCRLQYSAPLGSPVVPEVKMIATARSGSSGSSGTTSPEPRKSASTSSRAAAGGASITSFGPARSSTAVRSRSDRRSFTPAVIAPTFAAAQYARRYSGPGGNTSASTSPSPRPRADRPAATSSDTRSMSA